MKIHQSEQIAGNSVEPHHKELDTRSAPFEEGLKSLLFLRHTDEDDDPLMEVCSVFHLVRMRVTKATDKFKTN